MDCVYKCVAEVLYDENIGYYKSYGILLEIEVKDISKSKRAVEKLVRYLNENNADPMHFDDIVEDYLAFSQ